MKRLVLIGCLFVASCAGMSALQKAQVSHDYLALAQDTEASLCWGVTNIAAAIAANVTPNHCTSPIAATVGLTDTKHQSFNMGMKQALELHRAATVLLASGGPVNLTALNAAIADLVTLVGQLTATHPQVANLTLDLQKAKVQ